MPKEVLERVADDRVVAIEFLLTDEDGETLDRATPEEPLVYLHGHGTIAGALETALLDREAGERFEMQLSPEEFIGPKHEGSTRVIPRDAFPETPAPRVGMQIDVQEDDTAFPVWVVGLTDSHVHVSLDHPWAGRSVKLVAEVLSVRAASEGELARGEADGIKPADSDAPD